MALILVLALAGCAGAGAPLQEDYAQRAAAYAGEPYPVLLVDRRKFDRRFWPTLVTAPERRPAGSILIDTQQRVLYFFEPSGMARRYGIAVGASGYAWSGTAIIGRKAGWPAWYPTDDMKRQTADLPARIEPGAHNPLGARALYLFRDGRDTLYRIHGTSEPWTIGTEASSGCIRMLNEDVIDLYNRVQAGASVTVI
jgi:lipoprotein-anchoring transpeptidase ErfK/SrfK